jgi:TnpA family transposase
LRRVAGNRRLGQRGPSSWVRQSYVRAETLTRANAALVAAQNRIPLAHAWGGGDVASADGLRFVVPVRTIRSGPNPRYYGHARGVTFYNLVSDQLRSSAPNEFTGLNGMTVPGTLRDSLNLLSVVLEQQTELQPTEIMSDTGATPTRSLGSSISLATSSVRAWLTSAARGFGAWTARRTMAP